jgi:hypothetical protein
MYLPIIIDAANNYVFKFSIMIEVAPGAALWAVSYQFSGLRSLGLVYLRSKGAQSEIFNNGRT